MVNVGLNPWLCLVIGLILGLLFGFINGIIITRLRLNSMVATIGMVDALSPAVDALAANADKGLLEMLKAAEASAKQGVEDTKKYVAKFGRAKSLLERAIGHQDAGATSVYLIFQGMREFVEGKLA